MDHFSETNLACLHRRQSFARGFLQEDTSACNVGARHLRQYQHLLLNESVIPTYLGDLRELQGILTNLVPVAEPRLRASPALALFMQTAALPEMQRDLALHSDSVAMQVYGRSADLPEPVAAQTRALRNYFRAHMSLLNSRVERELFGVPLRQGINIGGGGPELDRAAADLRLMRPMPPPYQPAAQTLCSPLLEAPPAVPFTAQPAPAAASSSQVEARALAAAGQEVDLALSGAIAKFGYRSPEQERLVHAAAVGANVMAVLRTGAGKTMAVVGCMLAGLPRIAGQQQRNLVVLVVPLLALKQAIVGSLQKYFKSDAADEVLAWAPTASCLAKGIGRQVRVVVVTVEDVVSEEFLPRFAGRVSVLFVDEAHWLLDGQSFRPGYPRAPAVIRALACPVVCMTATATPKMRRDILELLSLHEHGIRVLNIAQSCQRTDMVYRVTPMQRVASGEGGEVDAFVRLVLATWAEPEWRSRRILIYCLKRESCPKVAERLRRQMANAATAGAQVIIGVYMGGGVDNPTTLAAFTAPGSTMRALVGTDSIGCGLDVADIGIVFHYGAAATSVERFLQQTGRAGRSGRPGEGGLSVVVPSVLERSDVEKAIKEKEGSADGSIAGSPGPKYWADSAAALDKVKLYAMLTAPSCRQEWLAQHMGEERPELQACRELCKATPLYKFRCDLCCAAPLVAANAAAGAAFTAAQAKAAADRFKAAYADAEGTLLDPNCFHCSLESGQGGPCRKPGTRHERWPKNQCSQCCSTTHNNLFRCPLFGKDGGQISHGRCYRCLRPKAGSWVCTGACNNDKYGGRPPVRAIGMAVRVLEWAVTEGGSCSGAATFVADVKKAAGPEALAMAEAAVAWRTGKDAWGAVEMDEGDWLPVAKSLLGCAREDAREVCRAQLLVWLVHRRAAKGEATQFDHRALV